MALDYTTLLEQVVALEIEALASMSPTVAADAKPYFFHTQEAFPYFTNRIGGDDVGADSQEYDRDVLQVIMRLVVAHVTEGYVGEPETKLYTYIPVVKTYFNERPLLGSDSYDPLDHLLEARVINHTGLRIFQATGLNAMQVGAEFTLQCQFDETINEVNI